MEQLKDLFAGGAFLAEAILNLVFAYVQYEIAKEAKEKEYDLALRRTELGEFLYSLRKLIMNRDQEAFNTVNDTPVFQGNAPCAAAQANKQIVKKITEQMRYGLRGVDAFSSGQRRDIITSGISEVIEASAGPVANAYIVEEKLEEQSEKDYYKLLTLTVDNGMYTGASVLNSLADVHNETNNYFTREVGESLLRGVVSGAAWYTQANRSTPDYDKHFAEVKAGRPLDSAVVDYMKSSMYNGLGNNSTFNGGMAHKPMHTPVSSINLTEE